ncbi:hypothetical protein AAFF_G00007170 [Aldrovandia affinis]|uniref:Uncharacterized protein n=1 Tax=Aldrovandia affinis TaxID=143900 RepID=A0AAD7X0K8_9TELE|nr:hypothetical protein AAFF_G00007170 [Aldrovandia affinis]
MCKDLLVWCSCNGLGAAGPAVRTPAHALPPLRPWPSEREESRSRNLRPVSELSAAVCPARTAAQDDKSDGSGSPNLVEGGRE